MIPCPEIRRLQAEHARWLALLGRGAAGDRAARLLALWVAEIAPHCRYEEEILVPELAGHLSEADAVIVFTLGDHVELRRLARRLREASPADAGLVEAFERKLSEHVAFEERMLFPALQESLGCDALAAISAENAKDRITHTGKRKKGTKP